VCRSQERFSLSSHSVCKQWGKVYIINKKVCIRGYETAKKVYIDAKKVCIVAKKVYIFEEKK
jgi:hypothetical protein